MDQTDVGFIVGDKRTRFYASKRLPFNYDWELDYSTITGIAFANVMRFDDDSFFMIVIRCNEDPIYLNGSYRTEEMRGYEEFMTKLKQEINLEEYYETDKIVIAYPHELKGRELYEPWHYSLKAFKHAVARFFDLKHHVSGIIREEYRTVFSGK